MWCEKWENECISTLCVCVFYTAIGLWPSLSRPVFPNYIHSQMRATPLWLLLFLLLAHKKKTAAQ